jgi:repressor LexA
VKKKPTVKQQRFLTFIKTFRNNNGYAPSVRQIANGLGHASNSGVKTMLDRLAKKGLITKIDGIARTICLTDSKGEGVFPILAHTETNASTNLKENIEGHISLKKIAVFPQGAFFIAIKEDSMKDLGIIEGDYAFIEPARTVPNGQIGAFRVNGEVTVKKFKQDTTGVYLIPANEDFKPVRVRPEDEFEVLGKYILLLRFNAKEKEYIN